MPYVNVPNDLSKIKTKMAFNLTKRQLVCFGGAAAVGIPSYLLAPYAFSEQSCAMDWRSFMPSGLAGVSALCCLFSCAT